MVRSYPRKGEVWHHFKEGDVKIANIEADTETKKVMVYFTKKKENYSAPLKTFMKRVNRFKYPDADQKYLFERVKKDVSTKDILKPFKGEVLDATHFLI